ncbi:MAG: GlsB/YeaQ/YmgE family stress response membrane protein [Thiotrichaceae bacterium]
MEITQIVTMLAIGAVAGWLAGLVMKGGGFGLIGNIILGIVGSVVGTFIGGMAAGAGVTLPFTGLVGTLVWAVIGAIVLLVIVGLIRKILT